MPGLKIDPSLLHALGLDEATTTLSRSGGSGFTSTFRLTTPQTSFFVKTAKGESAKVMFEGEHASLNAIHDVVPSLCPKSLAWGQMVDDKGRYWMATEFLELGRGRGGKDGGSGMSLAQKLAKLHSTTAPIPAGYEKAVFGFPVSTCCGDTPQENGWEEDWGSFFGKKRLMGVLKRGEERNGRDKELRSLVERTVREVVPRLVGEGHLGGKHGIKPVVVHGDLWSGNSGTGRFVGREDDKGGTEEVIYDPSACYAHSEYELGIMKMFGGYSGMLKEYHSLVPKTEPAEEYEDRVRLYESYHHLNHWAIFGGSYKSGAMGILRGLIKKYGDGE